LGFIAAGPKASPSFQRDYCAVQYEVRRAHRVIYGGDAMAGTSGTRINEIAEKWNWSRTGEFTYETPAGILDMAADGKATILHAAVEGWRRAQWRNDNRGTTEEEERTMRPLTDIHEDWMSSGSRKRKRVASGAAMDERALPFLKKTGKRNGVSADTSTVCMCGAGPPRRRHWMWACPCVGHSNVPPAAEPRSEIENGLGVPLVPIAEPHSSRNLDVDNVIVDAITREGRRSNLPVLLASDGGIIEPTRARLRIGGFGIAVASSSGDAQGIETNYVVQRRGLGGLDQTSYAAELQGAIVALKCAAAARTKVKLIIDNMSVQRGVQARILGHRPRVRYCGALWRSVEKCIDDLVPGCSCDWVPAHGRHLTWTPPAGESAAAWREVNDFADDAASCVSRHRWDSVRAPVAALESQARTKALSALLRTLQGESDYCGRWLKPSDVDLMLFPS
jgi:ribonuclease HI